MRPGVHDFAFAEIAAVLFQVLEVSLLVGDPGFFGGLDDPEIFDEVALLLFVFDEGGELF